MTVIPSESTPIGRRHLLRAAVIASALGVGALGRFEQRRLQAAAPQSTAGALVGVVAQPTLSAVGQTGWVLPEALSASQVGELRSQGGLQVGVPIANTVARLKGAPLWQVAYQLTVQAQNAVGEIHILNIGPATLNRSAPLNGTLLWDPELAVTQALGVPSSHINTVSAMNPAGIVNAVDLELDLDNKSPVVTGSGNASTSPFFENYIISLAPGEVQTFNLTVESSKYSADFYLSLVIAGSGGVTSEDIGNSGVPFRASAGAGNWPSRIQPDFASYRRVYVASGTPPNQQWSAHDPSRHVSPVPSNT